MPLQLFTTTTGGGSGLNAGAALPTPAGLVHPFIVDVTVYNPGVVTVIEEVVSFVLHNKLPPAVVDKVEEPQVFATVTTGADGIG